MPRYFRYLLCLSMLWLPLAHGAEVLTQFDTDASIEVDNDEMLVAGFARVKNLDEETEKMFRELLVAACGSDV